MRTLKLPGASIYRDNNGTAALWRARLGKTFTGGVTVKKSFRTYRDAADWLRGQVKARAEHGRGAFLMSDAEIAEAQNAFKRLAEAKLRSGRQFSLSEAVTFFLRHGAPEGGRKRGREVINAWIAEKAKTISTLHGVRSILDRFTARFGDRLINEITAKDCQRFIDGLVVSANSKNHYSRDLSTVFEWAMKPGRQWIHENPWLHLNLPRKTPIEIGILTPIQAGKLLTAAAAQPGVPLLGSLVLGLFAGLRAAERARIDWSAVQMDRRQPIVEIKAAWAKTSARRTVRLTPAAMEWLRLIPQPNGMVNPKNCEARFEALCESICD